MSSRVRLSNYREPGYKIVSDKVIKDDKRMKKEIQEKGGFTASSGLRRKTR